MAILDQLYNIALGVWSLMEKHVSGSFTAREVQKRIGPDLSWGENDMTQRHEVAVGTFSCEFPTDQIFSIVTRFEAVAGIGSKRRLFTAEEKGETIGSVTVEVNKGMFELCGFVDKETRTNSWTPLSYIFIDAEKKCLVATNGHRMLVIPANVMDCEGDTGIMLLDPKVFRKICMKAKGNVPLKMEVRNVKRNYDITTIADLGGLQSVVLCERNRYPNWKSCVPHVCEHMALHFGENWQMVRSFAQLSSVGHFSITGKRGDRYVVLNDGKISRTVEIDNAIYCSFQVYVSNDNVCAALHLTTFYIGKRHDYPFTGVDDNGSIYLIMPFKNDGYVGEWVADGVLQEPRVEYDVNLLQQPIKVKADETETVSETSDKALKAEPKAKKATDVSRKFTFEAVGVKKGDKLTFVDGTEVWAIDGTKVAYMGEKYTLSGFCKAFMPEEKRNKANSYRGCAFFYKDGVKLEKLFKDVLKAREAKQETAEPVIVETLPETNDIQEPAADMDGQKEMEPNVGSPATARRATEFVWRRAAVRRMLVADYLRSVVPVRRKRRLRERKMALLRMWRYVPGRGDRLVMAHEEHHGWWQGVHTYPLPPPL